MRAVWGSMQQTESDSDDNEYEDDDCEDDGGEVQKLQCLYTLLNCNNSNGYDADDEQDHDDDGDSMIEGGYGDENQTRLSQLNISIDDDDGSLQGEDDDEQEVQPICQTTLETLN